MTTTSTGNGEWNAVVGAYDISDDVIINHDVTYDNHIGMTGGLTVNASKTLGEGAASKNMNVSGNVIVNGTLDLDRSSSDGNATFGSLAIGSGGTVQAPSHGTITITNKNGSNYMIDIDGTFTHNSGIVYIDTSVAGDKLLDLIPSGGAGLYNLKVNEDGGGVIQYNGNTTIAGYLTVEEGTMHGYDYNNSELTVTGDVTIENGGTLGVTNQTGACSFGSLTIESGGTYVATSGTTTIAGNAGGTANLCFTCTAGTFTHNNGTLNITGTDWGGSNYAHIYVADGFNFGNVTLDAGGAGSKYYQFREGAGTMYFNNVYIKSGQLRDYNNNNTFHIRGNLDVGTRGAGGAQAVLFDSDGRDNDNTTKLIVEGIATVTADGQFHVAYGTDGTDGCKVGGIRNVGGTVYAVEQE